MGVVFLPHCHLPSSVGENRFYMNGPMQRRIPKLAKFLPKSVDLVLPKKCKSVETLLVNINKLSRKQLGKTFISARLTIQSKAEQSVISENKFSMRILERESQKAKEKLSILSWLTEKYCMSTWRET